ncbi:solute carrier organic anion transporter family member 2B1 [Pristis pectinata]|uniref:solute carrier organic anion transporter family member 2B1 n=1 Tax=Pristis pectinata TaxID=685728 RepID=UPI00223CD0B7|nr:solute carrier organic anion transporter family member 2B1 [Pristis pectinata]XP_051881647.1 solute carrier organic anion transporter family member 2B1 [Pristis pectinata]XP_051881648.1 solute carrier organic anion transporter family member 2B1 [Pristis pectinata]XP_051881649.1 solute carrier organic anion transporter family member 2B1 [Pristis pectinata]
MGITGPPAVVSKFTQGEKPRRCTTNPFNSIKFFVLCHGLLQFSQLLVSGYMKSIISTVEKRFGMTSQNSGMLSSLNEIGSTVFIVFISYFGSRVHRPRLIGCGGILVSVAAFTMSLPHFIMGRYVYDRTISSSVDNITDTCQLTPMAQQANNETCGTDSVQGDYHMLSLLMVGQLLLGVGGVPIQPFGISYVDDYASNRNSPLYLGILFAVTVLGPGFGFVLGASVLRLFIDIDKTAAGDIDLEFGDPRWLGAWWLGFLMAASCVLIFSFPYFFFPREMPKEGSKDHQSDSNLEKKLGESKGKQEDDVTQKMSLLQFIKSFPRILVRTLRSQVYLMVVLAQVCLSALMSGLTVFIAKFLEQQFSVTASFANLLIGSVHVPGAVLGILMGGVIMRRFSINLRGSAIMCCLSIFVSICAATPLLFLGCATQKVAGVNYPLNSTLDIRMSCNQGCSCRDQVYNPVCAASAIEFISPCHAGCQNVEVNAQRKIVNYTNCGCVPDPAVVKPGTCGTGCYHLLLPFMFFLTLTGFVATLCQTPSFMLVLRSVKPEDKSLAIGIQFMLFRVLAWLPGPILYGSTIDSTCIRWESKCKTKAACRYYNLNLFRSRYIGLQMLFQCAAFLLFLMAFYFLQRDLLRQGKQAKPSTEIQPPPKECEEREVLMDQGSDSKSQLQV